MLLGTFEHNLDEKSRLTIPSKLRNQLGDTIYISKGFEGCLEVRSQNEFEIWYKEISQHSSTNSNARLLARQIFSNSSEIDFDSAGRIKIPTNLLSLGDIKKSVLILGIGDKIEIWDIEKYRDYSNQHLTDLESVANELGGAK
ncbi:cell division protein MraZ [Spiroplasma sabaudiense Ar-1343]|uniref:Transcriptional regulator MraZ n=1 Tax=Spiroplasma sabaudiense Ar-1343 TaxID=1276257 RepID=W6AJV3_9MOLU|nr:division/cell wall cluster transcriptional repressor MraZ [Spiroplasma sabaudiense]AHI54009.1 cell division protein MraZ [Spiroplasma sabaudiense Ar-1343]